MENIYEKTFSISLKKYVDEKSLTEGKGFISKFAKKLKTSQGQLSNVLRGERPGTETWRRYVADIIGIDYEIMIGLKNASNKSENGKIVKFPIQNNHEKTTDDRFNKMNENLKLIYDHKDEDITQAIEMNLLNFKNIIDMKNEIAFEKKERLLLKEEIEVLKKKISN